MNSHAETIDRAPAAIPAGHLWEHSFDAFTAELEDPFLSTCRLHDGPGIIWATDASYGRPGWIVTRYDLISEVFIDYEHFTAERPGMIADLVGEPVRLNPIEIDPPAHHGFRRILNPFFTPKAINNSDAAIRSSARELIAKFADKGGCEFIDEFSVPFPSYIFLDLMGMPRAMLPQFMAWQDGIMRGPEPMDRVAAGRAVYFYLKQFLEEQRRHPGNAFIKGIVEGQVDGRPMSYLETMGMLYVLYVGGLDTVYSTLGWVMRHLATHPELQQRLRDHPGDLPQAVEEFMRAFSVVVTHRQLREDHVFHGVQMRKGDEINLPICLANRDPSVFANPHLIDIDRKSRHINFGTGTHNCVGVHLAKREVRIVIEEFLAHFRNIRIRDGENVRFHTGRTFGLDYLPLEWDCS